ncbi:MAG TPA: hypothetical protein VFC97_04890, partial [Verrucomicrobiae bacterium]|nr:hypothetical protein [Verrucomicrobiae bacterium]
MPKPHPYRPRRSRSGDVAGTPSTPPAGAGLGADAAAAAEASAEAAAEAEAASWAGPPGRAGASTPTGPLDEPPGWFRDEPLSEAPGAQTAPAPAGSGMGAEPIAAA